MSRSAELPRDVAMKTDWLTAIADDGCYFRAINPTPGTGLAQGVLAAFDAAKALFVLKNPSGSGKLYYPTHVRFACTVVPASATRVESHVCIDRGARYASGGTQIAAVNANMNCDKASQAKVYCGTLVLNAAIQERKIANPRPRSVIPIIGDEYVFSFTGANHVWGDVGDTSQVGRVMDVGPCVIGPGEELIIQTWYASNAVTGASYEVEAAWFERDRRS